MFEAYVVGNEALLTTRADGRPLSRSQTPPRLRRPNQNATFRNAYAFDNAGSLGTPRPWPITPRSESLSGCQNGARVASNDEMLAPPLVHSWSIADFPPTPQFPASVASADNQCEFAMLKAALVQAGKGSCSNMTGEGQDSGNESYLSTSTGTNESDSDGATSDSPRSPSLSVVSFARGLQGAPGFEQPPACNCSDDVQLSRANITSDRKDPEPGIATYSVLASGSPTDHTNQSVAAAREAAASAKLLGQQVGSELHDLDDEMRILTRQFEVLRRFVATAQP